jgi:Ca2+-binding RTX toxin-like protein
MARRAALAAVVLLLLPAAVPARGETTFCVGLPTCAGTSYGSLQRALTAAAASPGMDTVLVGPGTFRENAAATAGNAVEIRGAGSDRTTLSPRDPGQAALELGDPSSRVTALTIRLPAGAAGGLLLDGGIADGIQVIGEPDLTRSSGVVLRAAARFVNGSISLPVASPDVANFAAVADAPVGVAVDNSALTATVGLLVRGGSAAVTRTRIQAVVGLGFAGGGSRSELRAYDDLVVLLAGPSSRSAGIVFSVAQPGLYSLLARHLTVASMAPGAVGAAITADAAGATVVASIEDSILTGTDMVSLYRRSTNGGSARVSIDYSDFPRMFENVVAPGSSGYLALGATNANADPHFVGGGDYHLRSDSPLVDRGSPRAVPYAAGEPTVDLDGARRIFDGDNDLVARRDMGAYEVVMRDNRVTKTGTRRNNVIRGTRRDDALYGRAGKDVLTGGAGNDWLYGGPGADKLYGEAGDDELFGSDGTADLLACGPGRDVAFVDAFDRTRACESVVLLPVRFGTLPAQQPRSALPPLPTPAPVPAPVITPPLSPSLSITKDETKKPPVYRITGSGWDKCENDVVLTNVTTGKAIGTPDPDTSGNFAFTTENLKTGDVVRGEELVCDGAGDTVTAEATAP